MLKDNIGGCWDNIEGGGKVERTIFEGVGITLKEESRVKGQHWRV